MTVRNDERRSESGCRIRQLRSEVIGKERAQDRRETATYAWAARLKMGCLSRAVSSRRRWKNMVVSADL